MTKVVVLSGLLVLFNALMPPAPVLADQLKDEAVARLASSLESAVPVAIGRVVVKQAGLLRARAILAARGRSAGLDAGWNASAPEWQRAEARLMDGSNKIIAARIEQPEWFYAVLRQELTRVLDGEEADYIATHFTTNAGREQRILIQMRVVAELLMTNYSFTGRINHTVPGLERELAQMQDAYWALEPFRIRDFMNDPQAIKFAGQAAGLKYTRMLAIQGIEGFAAYIDAVTAQAQRSVDTAAAEIDPFIEQYRARQAQTTQR